MTKDEIINMAREAGAKPGIENIADGAFLERFYALAVAKEREACAQVCATEANKWPYPSHGNAALTMAATAIRARCLP